MNNSSSSPSEQFGGRRANRRRVHVQFFIVLLGGLIRARPANSFSCDNTVPCLRPTINHATSRRDSGSALRSTRTDDHRRTWNVEKKTSQNGPDNRSWSRQKMKPMPITGYNAKKIEEYYDRRPLQVGWRLNSLGFPLLGTISQRRLRMLDSSDHCLKCFCR